MFTRRFVVSIALILSIAYISIASVAFVHGVAMSRGMEVPLCDHADGMEALCDTFSAGINLWQQGAILRILILVLLSLFVLAPQLRESLAVCSIFFEVQVIRVTSNFSLYQKLFSSGILHPKAP